MRLNADTVNISVATFKGAFANLRKATVSFMSVLPSVHMEQLGSHCTDFHEICYLIIFRNFSSHSNRTRITGTLHKDQYTTFLIISSSFLLRMKNVSDKNCRENGITHFTFSNFFFSFKNHAIYDIMLKITVELSGPQMKIWRMRTACWIPRVTKTHPGYILFMSVH